MVAMRGSVLDTITKKHLPEKVVIGNGPCKVFMVDVLGFENCPASID